MPANRLTVIAIGIVGVILIVDRDRLLRRAGEVAAGFFPGHEAGSTHHHVKHGIAALLLGLGAFVFAWFQTGRAAPARPVGVLPLALISYAQAIAARAAAGLQRARSRSRASGTA